MFLDSLAYCCMPRDTRADTWHALVRVCVCVQGIYMVVSDKNAKWKGEPIPTPEEETQGHW